MIAVAEKANERSDSVVRPMLTIVVPTYNERANMEPLVAAVSDAMGAIAWEMIVVDDDSPDGTFDEVQRVTRLDPRVRCIRRVGRRGLSSAVIEGAMAASGELIAVMDADFQHDERVLPTMYEAMCAEDVDLVIGTRYSEGGSVGDWSGKRRAMSNFATTLSRLLTGSRTNDPMSGFFMVRQTVIAASIYYYSQQGYKVLLDIISSAPYPLKIKEVPYVFRNRREGESKISAMILAEFFFLLIEKLSRGWIPPRFVLFAGVGGLGLIVHIAVLQLAGLGGMPFLTSQILAITCAVVFNFVLNNQFTYRDRRLTGMDAVLGLVLFAVVCSVGAIANVTVADLAIRETNSWTLAGVAGALMSAVYNFGVASNLIWGRRKRPRVRQSTVRTTSV